MGLRHWLDQNPLDSISILEYGFGTGLNAFLTFIESEKRNIKVDYTGLEAFPCGTKELNLLNYHELLQRDRSDFQNLHSCWWDQPVELSPDFVLTKRKVLFHEFVSEKKFDLIYYDAFGARVQPELWTKDNFERVYDLMANKGVLVTYSSKGSVRRDLAEVGFEVERLQGPPGKRHMLRATKIG